MLYGPVIGSYSITRLQLIFKAVPTYALTAKRSQMKHIVRLCVCMCVWVCVSEDMSPYCSEHDEWLIMKLCMYVVYHDANNASNCGGDPVTQLNVENVLYYYFRCFTDMALHSRYAVPVSVAVATRPRADCSSMEDRRGSKRPYKPQHSPTKCNCQLFFRNELLRRIPLK